MHSDREETDTDSISHSDNPVHDSGIISKIDVQKGSIEISDDWDYYGTVLIDSKKLNFSAIEGNINLTLMNETIEIIIQTSSKRPDGIGHKGFSDGKPEYNVDITIREEEVYASITTYDWMYNIFPTDIVVDGEIVHIVSVYDILDTRAIEEKYPVDPLTFELVNKDGVEHEFSIEVYDPYRNLIFNESYSLQPGETIYSFEISEVPGMHQYVYTLDNKDTFTLDVSVERATNLGSSQRASFIFIDDPEEQMAIAIEQA